MKYRRRILSIFWNMLKQTAVPLIGLLFSWLITKKFSMGLWGEITQITLWVGIITHLTSWGNTEYLLKEFSAKTSKVKLLWQDSFINRLPLLLITSIEVLFYFKNGIGLISMVWCLVEYIYQSYEPIISFYKKFMISVIAEVAGALILFTLIFVFRLHIDLFHIISFLMLGDLVKTIAVVVYFKKDLLPFNLQRPSLYYYKAALSFFLLGFIGLLYSKADLIFVTSYMGHNDIAFYQISTNFFSFAKSGASMLILPFVPLLYRVRKSLVDKLSFRFTVIGVGLSFISFVIIYFILTRIYRFDVGFPFMMAGFLSILPAFYSYAIVIFLFRHHKQNKVVWYSIIGIIITLIGNAMLVPHFGTLGAISATAIAQWAVIPLYLYEVSIIKVKG